MVTEEERKFLVIVELTQHSNTFASPPQSLKVIMQWFENTRICKKERSRDPVLMEVDNKEIWGRKRSRETFVTAPKHEAGRTILETWQVPLFCFATYWRLQLSSTGDCWGLLTNWLCLNWLLDLSLPWWTCLSRVPLIPDVPILVPILATDVAILRKAKPPQLYSTDHLARTAELPAAKLYYFDSGGKK